MFGPLNGTKHDLLIRAREKVSTPHNSKEITSEGYDKTPMSLDKPKKKKMRS